MCHVLLYEFSKSKTMSTEAATFDVQMIESLIESGQGDQGRLMFIRRCMERGRRLYESDRTYLETLVAGYSAPAEDTADVTAPSTEDDEIGMVRRLMQSRFGDQGRLEYMHQTLESGGLLHRSDAKYLRTKYADMPEAAPAATHSMVGERQPEVSDPAAQTRVEEAGYELTEGITARTSALEAVKAEMESAQRQIEDDRRTLESISDYKSRLAGRIDMHQDLLQKIRDELRSVKDMIKEQSCSLEEMARALEAIRSERMELEADSQRLVGVTAELVEERKRLATARKENRALKEKERSLTKSRKDIEKVNREMQKEREKIAKKLEEEKSKLKEQTALKRSLDRETAKLDETREKRDQTKRGIKMAERVLEESRLRSK